MLKNIKYIIALVFSTTTTFYSIAQRTEAVKVVKSNTEKKVDIFVGEKLFTSFLYPDTLEKPVLYPVIAANGTIVTRGFPLNPVAGDPNDHPHHIGIWFNFENLNGLDFWNNSFAIAKEKKQSYGWIKTDRIIEASGGKKGILAYHANWTNQNNDVLLEEATRFEITGSTHQRIIDRITTFTASTDVVFTDAKDGMLGIRLAHALQIPTDKDEKFTDDKGNITILKGGTDKVPNGNYLSSEGKQGNDVWSTRGRWCKVFGKMGADSITVAIIDHPGNINYPTFWHARGYGLFAANPLGEKVFTNGKSFKNLTLKNGESVSFRYRIVVDEGKNTTSAGQMDQLADDFAKSK
ncbi:MAG: PmoA family protein [Ferruginibacter sp.]